MIWFSLALLVLLALIGVPLFAVVLAGAMLGFIAAGVDLGVVALEVYRIADTPLLVALPLFTFAGYVMTASNSAQRLMALASAFFGWMPAGLAIVGFVACAIFTALTGASGVTIVAIGALLLPMLLKAGYSERFSLGMVTTSGSLGVLIVPSVPLILFGVIAQQIDVGAQFTIPQLFLAGAVPVLLMLVALSAYTMWSQQGFERTRFEATTVKRALWDARYELPLPFVILGAIYSGYFAISEAAAITALYVLVAEVLLYKEVKVRQLPSVVRESMVMVGSIILILGAALALTNYFVDQQIPQQLFEFIHGTVDSPLMFLILLNVLLLVLGAFLDVFSATVIMVPLILPIAVQYGIHPLHLGVIFIANLQIGYFTPPIGMNLFIASYRFERSVIELYRACLPFMLVLLFVLLLVTYIPSLSLWFL
ncbi:MAG: TRAP transporter large permease subunit [Gammaproteobacteria bacterium]|nr:TRAP transporter large permease subunit [Gammaproteobacteria bacterium]